MEEWARRAAEQGTSPLQYMLRVMRDETAPAERRDDMAKAAAPYVHPKLQSIELHEDKPTEVHVKIDVIEIARELAWVLRRADAALLPQATATAPEEG